MFLCDAKGKQLAQLPVTSHAEQRRPVPGERDTCKAPRGRKLILAVSGNGVAAAADDER